MTEGLTSLYNEKLMREFEVIYEAGWYSQEHDGLYPFRWMSREASLRITLPAEPGKKLLVIVAGHSFGAEEPELRVLLANKEIGKRKIRAAFSPYFFLLEERGELSLKFILDRFFRAPDDSRQLGVMVRSAEIIWLSELSAPFYAEGWHEWEKGELFPFRWMAQEAKIYLPPAWRGGYLVLPISSEYFNQKQILTVFSGKKELANWPLLYQWNTYSLQLPNYEPENGLENSVKDGRKLVSSGRIKESAAVEAIELTLKLNRLFPESYHPEDRRELGIRVGPLSWNQDKERHQDITFFHQNAVKNYQEMMAGETILASFPVNLGVDLYARCNISPPCVYCLYDRMKDLEGEDKEVVVDDRTLASYGPFFKAARSVVNCSFGEPLLHPRLEEILQFCASRGKIVELSTNGQAFTSRTIRALLGKPIYLYVSLDAATAETYAKIRNERFDEIVANLMRLKEGRKQANGLPKIFLVFMPMRVNLHELEAYFELGQRIEADALVLRPLLYLENPGIKQERGGYLFDYEKELLTTEEIRAVINQAERLSHRYQIPLANQFEFGTIPQPGKAKNLTISNNSESS